MTLYEKIEEHGVTSRGKTQMLRHLNGEKLTRNQSISAKCFDCMGWYQDGRLDCRMPNCPLFPFRSYKEASKPVLRSPAMCTDIATKTPKRLKRPPGHSNAILREGTLLSHLKRKRLLESIVGVNKRRK